MLINNGDGTFHDESAQRWGFRKTPATGSICQADRYKGDCSLDIFPEFHGGPNGNESRIYTNDGTGHFTRLPERPPPTFGVPHLIDVNHNGKKGFISTGGDGFYLVPVVSGSRL